MEIRGLLPDEHEAWLRLRQLLWPDSTREDLLREQEEIRAHPDRNAVLVASMKNGELVGFVEAAIRDWAEGCSTRPVGYIEGWYVVPEHRRSSVGRALITAAESWAASCGCTEMGSDAELGNQVSRRAHGALGYSEVIEVVLFSKNLAKETRVTRPDTS